jgi:hypothetical protein
MASIDYKLFQVNPIGLEQISEFDLKTIEKFSVNTNFTPFEDKVELHVYGSDNILLDSIYDHRNFKFLQGSETVGTTGASEVTLDPIQDSIDLNYELGGVKLVYNFLDNLYSENQAGGEFFIEEISEDRTELRLLTNQITEEDIVDYTEAIEEDLSSDSYFNDFRLNVKGNDLLIGINIKLQDYRGYKSVIVKLYEALPIKYQLKQLLTIDRIVSDSAGYEVDTVVTPDIIKPPTLKGPNFSIGEPDSVSYPTSFLSSDELFSFPTNNTYRQVNSLFKEKGIELSIDYTKYQDFIQFSSAEERLRNFQYKFNLIESYQLNIESSSLASSFANTSGSTAYWTDKLNGVIQNFDHYDRHLYYGSGSSSWPKLAPFKKPYINAADATTGSFMTRMLASASYYDTTNYSSLINSVPEYLREDTESVKYSVFTHMLGQHFDNIWIYTKALSNKYDNDNRIDYGISKDLVQDTLKNFGVKIYTSFQSTEDLFNTFTGTLYNSGSTAFEQSGSNIIASLVSASNNGTYSVSGSQGLINTDSLEDYKRDINKRIYHNLPYLLKTKGTERGLKALIASFGVPTDNNISHITGSDKQNISGLKVRMIGGANRNDSPYFGPSVNITSSFDRIRIDNTGSIITGSTLSRYNSIMSRDYQYTDDIHTIEVGYAPSDVYNEKIISKSNSSFNIDDIIGDPRLAYSSSYSGLISQSAVLNVADRSHNYGELVRYLKYYDNVLFKMVKDFVPARSNVDTGLIIKPHLLERNKIKQVQGSFLTSSYLSEIKTAFSSASDGSAFTNKVHKELSIPLTASYTEQLVGPLGVYDEDYHEKERTRYDGEFSGSKIEVYIPTLNDTNEYKYNSPGEVKYRGKKYCYFTIPASPTPSATPSVSVTPSISVTPSAPAVSATPSPSVTPIVGVELEWGSVSASQICSNYAANGGAGIQRATFYLWDGSSWVTNLALATHIYTTPVSSGGSQSPAGAYYYSDGNISRDVTSGGILNFGAAC